MHGTTVYWVYWVVDRWNPQKKIEEKKLKRAVKKSGHSCDFWTICVVTRKSQHSGAWLSECWLLHQVSHHITLVPIAPLANDTGIINKIHHQNITQVSYSCDAIYNATTVGWGVTTTCWEGFSPTPGAKPLGEVGSTGSSCSRPRHSIRLHHQSRLCFASRPVVKSSFVGFDLQPLFIPQKCQLRDKQAKASHRHHSLWHRRTMWVPHLYAHTRDSLSPPLFVCYFFTGLSVHRWLSLSHRCCLWLNITIPVLLSVVNGMAASLWYRHIPELNVKIFPRCGAMNWAIKIPNNCQVHSSFKYGNKKNVRRGFICPLF